MRSLSTAAVMGGLLLAGAAHATPTSYITGQLNMGDALNLYDVKVLDSSNHTVDNNLASGVKLQFTTGLLGADAGVTGEDGSLDKINVLIGNVAYIKSPLNFKSFSGPIDDFFSATNIFNHVTVSFDLDTLTIDKQNSSTLSLIGHGTLHETGYADASAEWDFTTQAGGRASAKLSWSGDAFPVPEPSSFAAAAVGGIAMFGFSLTRRRSRAV